jgi:hypothetical protein
MADSADFAPMDPLIVLQHYQSKLTLSIPAYSTPHPALYTSAYSDSLEIPSEADESGVCDIKDVVLVPDRIHSPHSFSEHGCFQHSVLSGSHSGIYSD